MSRSKLFKYLNDELAASEDVFADFQLSVRKYDNGQIRIQIFPADTSRGRGEFILTDNSAIHSAAKIDI